MLKIQRSSLQLFQPFQSDNIIVLYTNSVTDYVILLLVNESNNFLSYYRYMTEKNNSNTDKCSCEI